MAGIDFVGAEETRLDTHFGGVLGTILTQTLKNLLLKFSISTFVPSGAACCCCQKERSIDEQVG